MKFVQYCGSVIKKLYISYLVKEKIEKYKDSGGALVVWSKDKVYKIENIGTPVKNDLENRRKIFNNMYPASTAQVIREKPLTICMERLYEKSVLNADAQELLRFFKKKGKSIQRDYHSYEGVCLGLKSLEYYNIELMDQKQLIDQIERICKKPIRAGVVHGDFHQGNIMFDGNNKIYLIDFDYSRENDIQAYDAFYYVFERERANTCDSWLTFWQKVYNKEWHLDDYKDIFEEAIDMSFEDIMIIFFIERLGGEYSHSYRVDRNEVAKAVESILYGGKIEK